MIGNELYAALAGSGSFADQGAGLDRGSRHELNADQGRQPELLEGGRILGKPSLISNPPGSRLRFEAELIGHGLPGVELVMKGVQGCS